MMEVGYRVVSQRPIRVVKRDGTMEPGFSVSFELDSGTTGEVEVPESLYSEPAVRALIEDKARRMAQVELLGGVLDIGAEG